MILTPTEMERLTLYTAAELARKRRTRGLRLNHPEAVALICDEILEGARDGKTVAELISFGSTVLTTEDVMDGVSDLMPMIQVEGTFPDGTKLVTVHDPIRPPEGATSAPDAEERIGAITTHGDNIEINPGRDRTTLTVLNTGDRPVQIGSHFHFFETNRALEFNRSASFGMRLDIPAGTAVRFEPGQSREVTLVEIGGERRVGGLNSLTNGVISDELREEAVTRAREAGFKGA